AAPAGPRIFWSAGGAGCFSQSNSSSPSSSPRGSASEGFPASLPERKIECRQQGARLVVVARGGAHGDVHAPDVGGFVVVDLREHDVLLDAERVIAAAVEALGAQAAEIADPRQRDVDEPVEKLVH